jgi:hypothetical protein
VLGWASVRGAAVDLLAAARSIRIRNGLAVVLVLAVIALPGVGSFRHPHVDGTIENRGQVRDQIGLGPLSLTPAQTAPEPALKEVATSTLRAHEVFAFAPYWTLPQASTFDVSKLSTVAYFGLDANPDGSLSHDGSGWAGFQSQELADLVSAVHRAGGRAVLTAKTFDEGALHSLATDTAAQQRLGDQLTHAITQERMDGANLDFEGKGSSERAGLAALVRTVANRLHQANPHWQVSVDTYASSAEDQAGWFDVQAMQKAVDAFFVMAYDMYHDGNASPNAPLRGPGAADEKAVAAYQASVPNNKIILGAPFYGYDWATHDNSPGSASSSAPTPVSYAKIAAAGHPIYWDPDAMVPWTAYQVDGAWHEIYYDDPTSLALKAQLADQAGILGVGIWALGMDGDNSAMLAALTGGAAPSRAEINHPNGNFTPPSPTANPNPARGTQPAGPTKPGGGAPGGGAPGGGGPVHGPAPPAPVPAPSPSPTPFLGIPLP